MKYNNRKFLSILLATTMTFASVTPALAGYSGNSTTGNGTVGGGGGGGGSLKSYSSKDQFFSYNLYFLEMPVEYLGNPKDMVNKIDKDGNVVKGSDGKPIQITKQQFRNEYWTNNAGKAMKIGKELLVSRDGLAKDKKAKGTIGGDAFSVYGQLQDSFKVRFEKGKTEFVNASEIGLENGSQYPVYMTTVNGKSILDPGKSTKDYFMENNANYIPNQTAEYVPTLSMKNLMRYLAGVVDGNGKAAVSFKEDKDVENINGVDYVKNPDSVFEEGTYQGKVGEYRLFIESGMIVDNVAYTVRELVNHDPKGGNIKPLQKV